MKAKHKRLIGLLLAVGVMGGAATVMLKTFKQQLIFFYTPTQYHDQLASGTLPHAATLRIGGLVKEGSVYKTGQDGIGFTITDLHDEIHASYHGLLPSLFREGQGVVAQGKFDEKGELIAATILAKHDENYMPPEVIDQLKKSGEWQHDYKADPIAKPPEDPASDEVSD